MSIVRMFINLRVCLSVCLTLCLTSNASLTSLEDCKNVNSFYVFFLSAMVSCYITLWANPADGKFMILPFILPSKKVLTFHANCLFRRHFARNVITYFLGKIRIQLNVDCWIFTQHASMKICLFWNYLPCRDMRWTGSPLWDKDFFMIFWLVCGMKYK